MILIHGAWAGSWVWQSTAACLEAAGFRVVAIDLPGVGSHPGHASLASLESHVTAVTDVIAGSRGVYLVAHSGGGVIATAVAEALPRQISGIVYVAGIMLPSGMSFGELCAEIENTSPDANGIMPYLELASGSTSVPPEAGVAVFFNQAPTADAIGASRQLGPWPDAVLSPVVTWTPDGFGSVPRLYLEAEFDRSIPLAMQRHMQQRTPGAARITLASDHAPQLSQPDELLAGIRSLVRLATESAEVLAN
ncbi:alpha/beta fold hydrolase [Subtercola sp. RTI3]|uniref:alpha/beta fold hydrolase n=1 Tax=Subtercola sp. RTI3 TaxID=3048639 RepID=UPI002B22FD9D|nr:alpha/beta fold hydrolase [Subtercola sp. RTI3]MEA9985833.1 alpha/beta fold hydrolase [Subtercola sp. RTI3]